MFHADSPDLAPTHISAKRENVLNPIPWLQQVLDAPQLQDDFYLNLVDWSSQNVLAVGLGACVYLWSACTSKVWWCALFVLCVLLYPLRFFCLSLIGSSAGYLFFVGTDLVLCVVTVLR